MRLILIGPPGVGKGTQGALLSQRLGIPSVSTGELLRQLIASGEDSILVREAREIESGSFVSDDFANRLALGALSTRLASRGFILDGYPRSLAQGDALESYLVEQQQKLDAVVVFSVTASELATRVMGRRVCQQCGSLYHLTAAPSLRGEFCDRCGAILVPRAEDDQPAKVVLRMQLYESRTAPLITFYRERGLVKVVSAEGTPDVVFRRICKALAISV